MTISSRWPLLAPLLIVTLCCGPVRGRARPNIIFVFLDDAGWGDFESTDSMSRTSNIERLRKEGLFLNQSYMMPMCAPARSALLTGRYPHTFGFQDGRAVLSGKQFWVNETFSLLPEQLQELGYKTHMLGKWHLGFCHPDLTPLGRGFDTFYGFVLGAHSSYYSHTKGKMYDWWDGDTIDWSAKGKYSTELLSTRAVQIVQNSNSSEPFFVYLSYQAAHGPAEVPQRYIDKYCSHVTNAPRQIHCAMMAAADEGIGQVVQELKDKGIYDNTVIVVMSDNGGPITLSSSNYPLRGGKKSIYEGGVRSYTVLKAPGLSATNVIWPGMIHAIDWLPTLVSIAGGKAEGVHGMDLWQQIRKNRPSRRKEFLYTDDDYYKFKHKAYRFNQWKLIQGNPGHSIGWYPPYHLLDTVPLEDVDNTYGENDFQLYNIEEDPEERTDLFKTKTEIAKMVKRKMKRLLRRYPLQPYVEMPQTDAWKGSGNVIDTCWCLPPGFQPCS